MSELEAIYGKAARVSSKIMESVKQRTEMIFPFSKNFLLFCQYGCLIF